MKMFDFVARTVRFQSTDLAESVRQVLERGRKGRARLLFSCLAPVEAVRFKAPPVAL